MRVAIVHDWLIGIRGGEKVLEALLEIFPQADLYTLVLNEKYNFPKIITERKIYTSFINKLPFANKLYKHYNPLFPFAIELFNFEGYDLVISSSHIAAKGVITEPDTTHISYIHTPVRYYWDRYNDYFNNKNIIMKLIIALVAPFYRIWDITNTNRSDFLIANSNFVAKRIEKYYKRSSTIIYPPVDTDKFQKQDNSLKKEDFYLIVSALVPYKRIDVSIEAFNQNKKKLIVVGKGEQLNYLKKISNDNIEFLGRVEDKELINLYAKAKGFIINSVEDFGIAPIEAQAAGTPVIAYRKGGALETIVEDKTGVFYNEQTPESLNMAIKRFDEIDWNKYNIIDHSKKFSKEFFIKEFKQFLKTKTRIS